jgi:hypothetical protein
MADNLGVTPGTGSIVAADDIGGVLHQRVKIVIGADGVSNGDISGSNPMPIGATSLPLPTGAATSALQTTINATLGSPFQVGGSIGNTTFASTQSGTWNINNITGTVSLPTGAATAANQTTEIASLASIDGKLNSLGQKTMAASVPVVIASDQGAIAVTGSFTTTSSSDTAIFGSAVSMPRLSMINADWSQSLTSNNVIVTNSGSGTATQASANLTLSTGASNNSGSIVRSNLTIIYVPGREIYTQFTAAFSASPPSQSWQRAGLYDTSNGVFFGTENGTLTITTRAGGTDTHITSFNGDALSGGGGSKFTRNGTPEAINRAVKNIYRIRFGWLGAGPFVFEVMSPDGNWVIWHTIRQPNTQVDPMILNPSLPITMEVRQDSISGTPPSIVSSSWDAGVVDIPNIDRNAVGAISSNGGTVLMNNFGNASLIITVSGTWVGTLQLEAQTTDGVWHTSTGLTDTGTIASSITANTTIDVNSGGYQQFRMRASAWTSGSANIAWNSSFSPHVLEVYSETPSTFFATVNLRDNSGQGLTSTTSAPSAGDVGLVVRNVPSGTQTVSGTVTANAGTGTFAVSAASLPLPTGAATSSLQTTGNTILTSIASNTSSAIIAPGTATTGLAGNYVMGAVSTSAPTYTTGQTSPLSLDTSGNLRVAGSFSASIGSGTKATYVCNTGPITGATATGTKSLAYLWHPNTDTKVYKLTSIIVDQIAGNGPTGGMRIEMRRLSAENGTPGGTSGTQFSTLSTNGASSSTVRIAPTGAPTRVTGALFGVNSHPTSNGQTYPIGTGGMDTLEETLWTAPASTAQGYEITQEVVSTLSTAPTFNITFTWTEV